MKNTSFDKSRIYSCGDLSFFEKFSHIVVETKRPCVLILSLLLPIIHCCFSKRYDGLQLNVLSERMSLQKTSKPNLKRRRCHLCGQFAGGNHVCANSIDIELHADEPLGVLYKLPKTSVAVSPVMVNDIQNCLTTLGLLQFLRPERRAIPNDTFLCCMRPSRVTPIVGDGNCLFTSLAVALGLTHDCGGLIRDIIVNNMKFINFPRNSLQTNVYSNDFPNQHHAVNCESVDEYLRISRMSENGVFGT